MVKTPRRHFGGDGWNITEEQFSAEYSEVAESVFSLGNEYMGSRGNLDEGTSAPTLRDSYFNGIYEYPAESMQTGYKGIVTRRHYMVNAADYWKISISVNGEKFDIAAANTAHYCRNLSLKEGTLTREVTWLAGGGKVKLRFCRFLDMENYRRAYQAVEFTADFDCDLILEAEINFNGTYEGRPSAWRQTAIYDDGLLCSTSTSFQSAAVFMDAKLDGEYAQTIEKSNRCLKHIFSAHLQAGSKKTFTRLVSVWADKTGGDCTNSAREELKRACAEGYSAALLRVKNYWHNFWKTSDIEIVGDDENQQGIRFCIFQLQQTYHAADPSDNIGAKGLTGEAYSGLAFWDTESYCLPYYLFNNPAAAKCLLMYRYKTLPQAKERAKQLDCKGACYPISTINGDEACTLWQHASLQMQPSTAVAYGIFHYVNVTGDSDFLYGEGIEMLTEICRYLATRGQWSPDGKYFGYYAVMGPDEFQMMVNHNTYTNFMAKKTFEYTLSVIEGGQKNELSARLGLSEEELDIWRNCSRKMKILYDENTLLYEQHEGYFSLPHIDINSIPDGDFPLYSHWSYDRIYRNDIIKQPDVLMFMFLYPSDFSYECKKANFSFYEPRCLHESSLSPSVHSILACELGMQQKAMDFFGFATRLDLDDYNRNTREGLHTTSIAAAWMNIVYGFGGLKSDRGISLSPILPHQWQSYSFNLIINGANVKFTVCSDKVKIDCDREVTFGMYGKDITVNGHAEVAR